eukprot:7014643-Ditylum_brightwellii.AAC.1
METTCIKDRPSGEGYKLFTLFTTDSYALNFTPDDKTATKPQQQEYKAMISTGKIESMILHVVSIISHLCDKQKLQTASLKSTRSRVKERNDDTPMTFFALAMDNFFTFSKVIHVLRNMRIGVISTSCFRKG